MTKGGWEKETIEGEPSTIDLPTFKVSTEKSRSIYEEARRYSPAGVQGAGRYYKPFPLFMKKAFGARIGMSMTTSTSTITHPMVRRA